VFFYQTTQGHIPKGRALQKYLYVEYVENLQSGLQRFSYFDLMKFGEFSLPRSVSLRLNTRFGCADLKPSGVSSTRILESIHRIKLTDKHIKMAVAQYTPS
jgi:hypothetical protein